MGIRIKTIRELCKRLLWRFMNRSSRFWMRYQIRNLWLSRDKVSKKKGEVKAEIQWLIKPAANALKDKVPTLLQGQTECLNYNLRLEVKTLRDQPSWTFKVKNLKNMDWPIKKSSVSLVMKKSQPRIKISNKETSYPSLSFYIQSVEQLRISSLLEVALTKQIMILSLVMTHPC